MSWARDEILNGTQITYWRVDYRSTTKWRHKSIFTFVAWKFLLDMQALATKLFPVLIRIRVTQFHTRKKQRKENEKIELTCFLTSSILSSNHEDFGLYLSNQDNCVSMSWTPLSVWCAGFLPLESLATDTRLLDFSSVNNSTTVSLLQDHPDWFSSAVAWSARPHPWCGTWIDCDTSLRSCVQNANELFYCWMHSWYLIQRWCIPPHACPHRGSALTLIVVSGHVSSWNQKKFQEQKPHLGKSILEESSKPRFVIRYRGDDCPSDLATRSRTHMACSQTYF